MINRFVQLAIVIPFLYVCGGKKSGGSAAGGGGARVNLAGGVKSATGSQTDMAFWVVAFQEKESGVAKVADLGAPGTYKVNGVLSGRVQTVVMLDSNYKFSSVIA